MRRSAGYELWTIAVGRAVSLLGDEIALVTLTLRLDGTHQPHWTVAALFAAGLLPLALLSGPVGRLVDRADSRVLLVSSSLVQAVLCLGLAYSHGITAMLVLVGLLGAAESLNGATWQALVPSISGLAGVTRATSLQQTVRTAAGIGAPALGGVLTGAFGTRIPLLVDVASYLAITIAALTIATRRRPEPGAAGTRALSGWAVVRADPVLRPMVSLLATFVLLGAAVNVVEVFLIRDTLHASSSWFGIAIASWAVGMLAGASRGGQISSDLGLARTMVASAVGMSLCVAGFALCGSVAALIPLSVCGGVANGLLNLTGGALMMTRPAPEVRGRVAAFIGSVVNTSLIAAYIVGGALSGVFTPREIFAVGGLLGIVAPLFLGAALLRGAATPSAAHQATAAAAQATESAPAPSHAVNESNP